MNLELLLPEPLSRFYNVHPMFVHAPLGLIPASLLLFILALRGNRDSLREAARICLWLGTLGLAVAAFTGWRAAGSIPHNEVIHAMMRTHRFAALSALALAVGLAAWSGFVRQATAKPRAAFLAGMVVLNLLLVSVGDLGARMVYLEGAAVKPAVESIGGEAHEHDAGGAEHPHDTDETEHHHDDHDH